MATNINVLKRLDSLEKELSALRRYIVQHSGIDERQAQRIDVAATDIVQEATLIAAEARAMQGDKSASKLLVRVRKALGFTYP